MTEKTVLIASVVAVAAALAFVGARTATHRSRRTIVTALAAALTVYLPLLVLQPRLWLLSDVVVLAVAVMVGAAIGSLLPSPGSLVAFCTAAAVADVVSFTGGATARFIEAYRDGTSNLLAYLSLSIPLGARIQPVVGIGDLIILVAVFFALLRLGIRPLLAFAVPTAGLLAALAVGLVVGGIWAIPFIAAATAILVLVHRRTTDSSRSES